MSFFTFRKILFCFITLFISTAFLKVFSQENNFEGKPYDPPTNYYPTVNDEYQFVWFRVHKVGTSTINQIFKRNNLSFSVFIRHPAEFNLQDYKGYFKFGFVRNPWDRVVSCYINRIVGKNTSKHSDLKECFDKDFDYFVDFIDRQDLTKANRHIRIQTSLIPLNEVDFIGRLETFSQDLQYVFSVIGLHDKEIEKNKGIPKANASKHKHYSHYYAERTKEIIARKYKDDIEAFGYQFEYE